ncbi:MAG: TIGR01440 family protein [Oscillospiraceae bacterium]|nr:TIGR01440 family protein [Oscillospiraceae bacterium]
MFDEIKSAASAAVKELVDVAKLDSGDLLVIGCSSSEICGQKIGSDSSPDAAQAVFDAIYPILKEKNIFIAAQCCEHLNRALIVEKELATKLCLQQVNVVPQPKAGGSFATCVYKNLEKPVAVEEIAADAGLDIGSTLIGMHLKRVAVPVRLSVKQIGEANITAARTRPKFIGGERAAYDTKML